MARKRSNGEGTIYLRSNGTWAGAITLPGRRRRYVYGSSRQEVRRKLLELTHAQQNGTITDSRGMTVGSYLDQWLEEAVKPKVRHWTYVGYEVIVRLHLKPALGRVRLDQLTPIHVQGLLNKKTRDGLSPKSVKHIRAALRAALNQAVRWGLVPRNAAALADPPRAKRFEIKPLTPEEARRFLAAVTGDRLEALYSVALTMGLRQGEALGLQWNDVDLDVGTLRVRQQLQRIDGKFRLVDLKTDRSRRTVVMPPAIVKALRDHRRRQAAERPSGRGPKRELDLVFTAADGRPLDGTTVTRQFHRHLERAGLEQRRFHDLRHSCATLLLVQGVSARVVMEILGHSEISMTLNNYSHVIPELRRDAADRLQRLLWSSNGQDDARDHSGRSRDG